VFTGLIKGLGSVRAKRRTAQGAMITIATPLAATMGLGDSIAVNGVCLTASRLTKAGFTADIMPETWKGTNLQTLDSGDLVNLEPALALGERFGGHLVSGHVDGVGKVREIQQDRNAVRIKIDTGPLNGILVPKGSVAVNGVSLTVQHIYRGGFEIALIPHTLGETNLFTVRAGDPVNIETDLLLKGSAVQGVEPIQKGITAEFLAKNGFI
jgi:riboflavin synthase